MKVEKMTCVKAFTDNSETYNEGDIVLVLPAFETDTHYAVATDYLKPFMVNKENLVQEDIDNLSFINTLEVKEVDLEKEINKWIEDNTCRGYCSASIRETAEHFFDLGLKAQKVE